MSFTSPLTISPATGQSLQIHQKIALTSTASKRLQVPDLGSFYLHRIANLIEANGKQRLGFMKDLFTFNLILRTFKCMPKLQPEHNFLLKGFIISFLIFPLLAIKGFSQAPVNNFTISPISYWVKKYPNPLLSNNYKENLVWVHHEVQHNHFTKEIFERNFYYVNNLSGLNQIKAYLFDYKPDYQKGKINKVTIYRKKERIHLHNQLYVKHTFEEKQIGGEKYFDNAHITIFFNQARVGDLLEIAFTIQGSQPDLQGHLFFKQSTKLNQHLGKGYLRILAPTGKINYTTTSDSITKPSVKKSGNQAALEFIFRNKTYANTLNPTSPFSGIYVYDLNSWKELTNLNLQNFQLDKVPGKVLYDKVLNLTNNLPTPSEKINAILNFTQNIYYLDYGLIDPKKPELVLKQGFGDCKSKSLLTVKMLECIKVSAWPVIVNNTGISDKLINTYSVQLFNHCVVEFINGKDTVVFDPTNHPQLKSEYIKSVENFRYGLRVIENNTKLSRLHSAHNINFKAIVKDDDKSKESKTLFISKHSVGKYTYFKPGNFVLFVLLIFLLWLIYKIKKKHRRQVKYLTTELEKLKNEPSS